MRAISFYVSFDTGRAFDVNLWCSCDECAACYKWRGVIMKNNAQENMEKVRKLNPLAICNSRILNHPIIVRTKQNGLSLIFTSEYLFYFWSGYESYIEAYSCEKAELVVKESCCEILIEAHQCYTILQQSEGQILKHVKKLCFLKIPIRNLQCWRLHA